MEKTPRKLHSSHGARRGPWGASVGHAPRVTLGVVSCEERPEELQEMRCFFLLHQVDFLVTPSPSWQGSLLGLAHYQVLDPPL